MTSTSETAVKNYLCLVWQVRLHQQLRLVWFYFDPLGTFTPLAGLFRLISCLTTLSCGRLHNHSYCSTTSLGPETLFGIEKPLRVSHVSTVLASVVSTMLPPTLHLKFCHIFVITCRLQWVPTPYTWSSTRASR